MTIKSFHAVCPRCFTPFVLKGSRLRSYERALGLNPAMKGPYCSYHCSAPSNLGDRAISAKIERLSKKLPEAASRG